MALKHGEYTRTYGMPGDDGSFGRFYYDAILNQAASNAAGREIWEDVEMVEIILPANPWTRPTERVTDEHRARWAKAYDAFKKEQEQRPEGKPLEEWPEVSRGLCTELKALDMFVVEQVAKMGDAMIQRLGPGARVLVQKAQAYCDEMARMGPINKLVAENETLRMTADAQARQITELGAICERLQRQYTDLADRPSALASHVPAMSDPVGRAIYEAFNKPMNGGGPAPVLASSLDRFAASATPARQAPEAEAVPAPKPAPAQRRKKAAVAA